MNCKKFFICPLSLKNQSGMDWQHCEMFYTFTSDQSYGEYLRTFYLPVPSPAQGWFLCYLFVYSQVLAPLFLLVHPNHQVRNIVKITY